MLVLGTVILLIISMKQPWSRQIIHSVRLVEEPEEYEEGEVTFFFADILVLQF